MRRCVALLTLATWILLTAQAWAQPLPTAAPESRARRASPILPRGYGFGLGFAVRKETGLNSVTGSAGEYRWGGAGGTAFWVDPKEQMVVVWMTQGQPGPMRGQDRDLFRQLVQAAIVD